MAQIQWFPGHMAKARREIEERVKLVDIIIELVDSRAPASSKNPMFDDLLKTKPRLVIMTKKDLSDDQVTQQWLNYYHLQDIKAYSVDLKKFNDYDMIISQSKEILKSKMEKERNRGLKPRAIRAMIIGIPNVGKSTLINCMAKRKATITGNRPGVTKAQQIIKINKDFELFDTPGVLWPRFDDESVARNIALIGSIKQQILPLDDLFIYAVRYLTAHYPGRIEERYNIHIDLDDDWIEKCFDDIAANKHFKKVRGSTDYDRVIELFFTDLYNGYLGKISWEIPDEK